jgi:hypothetical protein
MKRKARQRTPRSKRKKQKPAVVHTTVERLETLAEQLAAASKESQAIAKVVREDLVEALQDAHLDPVAQKQDKEPLPGE